MDIIKYLERVTVIFSPDGTVRGSEAHEHTGYLEERDVPDAPGGKQLVFVVVKPEVREVAAGDLAGALDDGCPAIEDAAVKSGLIGHLQNLLEETGAELVRAEGIAASLATTVTEQTAKIAELNSAVDEGNKLQTDLRDHIRQLVRENGAMAAELVARDAELAALREATAREAAPVE